MKFRPDMTEQELTEYLEYKVGKIVQRHIAKMLAAEIDATINWEAFISTINMPKEPPRFEKYRKGVKA